jgi:pimeloyl-ACP methyl ester carboxylesterase
MPVARANGVNLYYELSGGNGDPIMLIHGSWSDHSTWNPVVAGLSESFRVLTYDRRGHSRSEKSDTQGSGEEDASDAGALLAELHLAPAHVVGNSFGGSVALKLAAGQPSVVRSLNVHEPPLFDLLSDDPSVQQTMAAGAERRQRVIRALESGDRVAAARLFVDTLAFGPGTWDRMPAARKETMITNADTWLDETRDPQGSRIDLGALAKFTKPALLSYGGKGLQGSKLVIDRLSKALPNSKVLEFPNDGHSPQLSNPSEFVRTASAFAMSGS